ncbi:hypothetical protein BH09ACT13_BH09ACT13_04620 [soil metagenome]
MPDGSDPRRAMHSHADVALLADDGLTRVQPHPHADLATVGPVVLGERALRDDRRSESRIRTREREEERVSLRVDLAPAALGRGLADGALVLCPDGAVALAQVLEQPRRPLDVGEEECDGAGRQLGHTSPFGRTP